MDTSTIIMIIAIVVFAILPSLKSRTVPIKKLIIVPAIFAYFCYQTINETFVINNFSFLFIILGLLIGISIGAIMRYRTPIQVNKEQKTIALSGSYFNLVLFILIFSVHYIIGYLQAVVPVFFQQAHFQADMLLFLLICVSSLSIGSNASLFIRYCLSSPGILLAESRLIS